MCRRRRRTTDLPSLRFLAEHVVDRQILCVLQALPAEQVGPSAYCLCDLSTAVVLPMGHPLHGRVHAAC